MCGAGDDRVGFVLRGHVVVCEETRGRVYRGLQPARADNGRNVRCSSHARAAPSRKVAFLYNSLVPSVYLCCNHCCFFQTNSVIGSVIVIVGLYIMLWGKDKEMSHNQEKLEEGNEELKISVP